MEHEKAWWCVSVVLCWSGSSERGETGESCLQAPVRTIHWWLINRSCAGWVKKNVAQFGRPLPLTFRLIRLPLSFYEGTQTPSLDPSFAGVSVLHGEWRQHLCRRGFTSGHLETFFFDKLTQSSLSSRDELVFKGIWHYSLNIIESIKTDFW